MWDRFLDMLSKYPKVTRTLGLVLVIVAGITATSIFFISYSLSRHKQMVAQLRSQVIVQETRITVLEAEKRLMVLQQQLKELQSSEKKQQEAREAIRKTIEKEQAQISDARKKLEKDLKAVGTKSISQLLEASKKLLQEVL